MINNQNDKREEAISRNMQENSKQDFTYKEILTEYLDLCMN